MPRFVEELNDHSKTRKAGLEFRTRATAPTGYETHINFGQHEGKVVAKTLRAHFNVYSQLSKEAIDNLRPRVKRMYERSVVQPAFVFYYKPSTLRDGEADAVFVPTIVPWGGPEKAGSIFTENQISHHTSRMVLWRFFIKSL